MLPYPMSRDEPSAEDFHPLHTKDLTRVLEQHVVAGFPPDLALDLVLNEFVVRAADLTHASAAALALVRGDEMVCRASTGLHAPDLGIAVNTQGGLSGACVRSREPQLCKDAQSDPRVDPVVSRRLGIRSMLVVPVFEPRSGDSSDQPRTHRSEIDGSDKGPPIGLHKQESTSQVTQPLLTGVLEVFSPLPDAFPDSAQALLEGLALDCARICAAADHLRDRPQPPPQLNRDDGELFVPADALSLSTGEFLPPLPRLRQPYEGWAIALGALVILAAAGMSFLIGSRVGWLSVPGPGLGGPLPPIESSEVARPTKSTNPAHGTDSSRAAQSPKPPSPTKPGSEAAGFPNELVVYEKGKVIFRMKPAPAKSAFASSGLENSGDAPIRGETAPQPIAQNTNIDHTTTPTPVVPASSSTRIASTRTIWLAPAQAETRLLSRVEPQYPADALAAHRAGNVVLEVHVSEDGTVSSVRTLSGDPLLAGAASQAVRNWRYQPYRPNEHPSPFQTDVTLTFSLPN